MSAVYSIIDNTNPHTVYFRGFHVDFWKDHRACGVNDEWDYCYIRAWTNHGPIDCRFEDKQHYNQMLPVLDRIFELGQDKAKEDLRKFLNIKDN